MKEFDTIGDYNQKFGKYAVAAGMDLSDPKLIERYMRSLVPHYAHKLKNALDANERPVRILKDAMDLADHSKRPVTNVYISPQSCDGSPEDRRNNNNKLSYF
ncbi:hypothetical protein G6F56_012717 [Rhizopus delemar]|nr:hypothetical protein G6F56_012717 [Rhizopus delemar]